MVVKGVDRYGHKEQFILITDASDIDTFKKSLLAVRKRLISSFEGSEDMSYRHWVNTHGPVLDELLEELGYRGKL